mmetsp:Transcript_4167/g.12302  ORF Transcript_4167/g.12302 Transcript_4167/m.12302 type:complete len:275 (+) Transcript_4167:277-1101(+)
MAARPCTGSAGTCCRTRCGGDLGGRWRLRWCARRRTPPSTLTATPQCGRRRDECVPSCGLEGTGPSLCSPERESLRRRGFPRTGAPRGSTQRRPSATAKRFGQRRRRRTKGRTTRRFSRRLRIERSLNSRQRNSCAMLYRRIAIISIERAAPARSGSPRSMEMSLLNTASCAAPSTPGATQWTRSRRTAIKRRGLSSARTANGTTSPGASAPRLDAKAACETRSSTLETPSTPPCSAALTRPPRSLPWPRSASPWAPPSLCAPRTPSPSCRSTW